MPHLHAAVLLAGLLLLSLRPPPCSAATDTVSPGIGLAGGATLVSNNSKFALGFFKTDDAHHRSPYTYLGIWFNKVPKRTPLWSANGDRPVVDPTLPELAISGDGDLVILDRDTGSTIWSAGANTTTNDTVAVLLNNGNLVLRSSSNASEVFWQSFDYPTDTFFAGAKIGWDKVTGLNRRLVSRKNLIDQAPGLYTLGLDPNGVGHLVWNSTVEIQSTGEWNGHYFSLAPEMIGAATPQFKFVDDDREVYITYTLRDEAALVLTKLDVFGQGMVGMWMDDRQEWLINYRQPVRRCDVHAVCGPFTVCGDDGDAAEAEPICGCMEGFSVSSPVDWELRDRRDGCARNTPLDCGGGGGGDKFYALQRVGLPRHGAVMVQDAKTGDACSRVCLSNCSCTAYSYGDEEGCSVWHGKLYSVRRQPDASSDGNGGVLYIRLAAKDVPSVARRRRKSGFGIVGVSVGLSSAALVLLVMIVLALMVWRARGNKWSARAPEIAHGGVGIIAFRYADLQQATKNFSEKLGGGGFGSVFKGCLLGGHDSSSSTLALAVKRLDGARQGEKQFRAEVSSVGIIQHINLVKLIGFCCEGDKRLLVYEYMPNHSLDVHLFNPIDRALDWSLRYQIALGVARGLAYLHTGCRDCIIHCDIKPENILLDASFVPKIADFGMAKVLGREFSQAVTTMRGTIGYLAPEWISGAAVTAKVDVYSYGMVLFEIISGRRNSSQEHAKDDGDYSGFFPMQAARKLLSGDVGSLVDANLRGDANLEEVERVCKVACWCIQDSEFDRPAMAEVVKFLEGLSEVGMPPVPRLLSAITGGSPKSPVHYFYT
jgi:hypothetical protein